MMAAPSAVVPGGSAMASTVSGSTPQVLIEALFPKYDGAISLGKDSGRWMSAAKGKDQDGRIAARSLQPEEYQRLKAALQKKKLVLAAPRVTVLDNTQATIRIEGGNPQYEMTITPSIQDRNRIVLDIEIDLTENLSPEGTPGEEQAVRSRTLTSRVMIGSGEAVEEFLDLEGSRDYAIIIQAEIME
jgi:type II secretory pathway component GspD/PulD (secretin)